MARDRLTTALDTAMFDLPEGEVAVLRPTPDYDLSALPRDRLRLTCGFRPDLDAFAAAGFDAGSLGVVDAGAAVCQSPMAGCTTVGSGTNGFLQSDYGDGFGHLVIYLGAVDTTLPAGSYLVTSISASVNSSTDLLVAYGTSAYPSQLRFW